MTKAILQIENLGRHYGGVRAVDDVSCHVQQGIVTALIGPNGAGKSTFLNVASGVTPASFGKVIFNGVPIIGKRSDQVCKAGIARTFQTPQLFPNLTVRENILVGATRRGHVSLTRIALSLPSARRDLREMYADIDVLLDELALSHLAGKLVGKLPFGQQRLVEIARGLASRPDLFMMDEPASGLSRAEVADFRGLILKIASHGISVLLVEHNMQLVMSTAEQILVLDKGKLLASGTPDEIRASEAVKNAYLGSHAEH
jgi:ABC-type branched-subunit amino acid transport system ATPase component